MEQWSDPGSGIKHPGSATLIALLNFISEENCAHRLTEAELNYEQAKQVRI
jgi:hypothetical protein